MFTVAPATMPLSETESARGDGLEETAWALKIHSLKSCIDCLRERPRRSRVFQAEIAAATEIDSSKDAEREARNQLKDSWKRRVTDLY